ncbi:MAG: dipicolinate synthase subunit B [Clostridia bacterium]|nr:dipicolinate synthase subunit B [Clostridia bacterium]
MRDRTIGFAVTGSYCTFEKAFTQMEKLAAQGWKILPIFSFHAAGEDTRFGTAAYWIQRAEEIAGTRVLRTLSGVEPIGPKKLTDIMLVAPCTGNTAAKLANNIIDTPVTLAVKSHLRGGRPVVLALSTNDALSGSAANIGALMNRRHYYFVPLKQDAPQLKPNSAIADFDRIEETLLAALDGRQIEPILL